MPHRNVWHPIQCIYIEWAEKLDLLGRGGGVLRAVKTNFAVERIHLFDITNFYCESVWLKRKVPHQKGPLQTGVFYLLPNTDDALTEYFHSTSFDCPIVILCDFNLPNVSLSLGSTMLPESQINDKYAQMCNIFYSLMISFN